MANNEMGMWKMICRPKTSEHRTSLNRGWVLRLISSSVQLLWWLVPHMIILEKRPVRQSNYPLYMAYLLCNGRSLPISHQRWDSSNVLATDICMPSGRPVLQTDTTRTWVSPLVSDIPLRVGWKRPDECLLPFGSHSRWSAEVGSHPV